ncbi:tRNA-specific 2-thiouridylase, partial [Peziza echinospora]
VFIALSSGIDSSVAAKLLATTHPPENLHPLYMVNWNPQALSDRTTHAPRLPRNKASLAHLLPPPPAATDGLKCTTREFRQVEDLCAFLGLRAPRYMNFEKEYWGDVFVPMVEGYEKGETPNPDVGCNRWVKFGGLLARLEREMAGSSRWWLATGHYAHIGYPVHPTTPHLLRSQDPNKDQTFYLSTIPSSSLARLIFPLSSHNLTKPAVYDLARQHKLPGWTPGAPERAESMGLCFVEPTTGSGLGAAGFRLFLNEFLEPRPGEIFAGPDLPAPVMPDEAEEGVAVEEGTVLGTHQGLWTATVGEKAHLSLPQGDPRFQGRWYVSRKDPVKNQIEVVRGWGNGRLWSYGMVVRDWNWLLTEGEDHERVVWGALERSDNGTNGIWEQALVIQFRHRQKPVRVRSVDNNTSSRSKYVKILFETPQRAVTVGQNAAMWWGERCLGGGVICGTVDSSGDI